MGLVPLCLLLPVTALALLSAVTTGAAAPPDDDGLTWPHWRLPLVSSGRTVALGSARFAAGGPHPPPPPPPSPVCGIECQRRLPEPSAALLEELLAYETVYENGTRTQTSVTLRGLNDSAISWPANATTSFSSKNGRSRKRREVYGTDTRFTITDKHFSTKYPFSTSVKISTGCSGVLVSPRHVLTAAHCVHDGRDYLAGAQKLRVGVLKEKSRRGRGGKGRGGGGGGGGRGKGKKRKGERDKEEEKEDGGGEEGDEKRGERRGKGRGGRKGRSRRSAEAEKPSFRWTRVKQTQLPKGWFRGVADSVAADYDYAVLELKKSLKKLRPMDLGVVASVRKLPGGAGRIHFSGFDDDRPGNLVYRFCSVSEESKDLLYQRCDAKPGSSGSGVYVRLKEPGGGKRAWKRKVIGVFSGRQWVDVNGDGGQQDFNVAVRITPLKYAQICLWVHGDAGQCRHV